MGRYEYSDSEKELNKVLKMQEKDLTDLSVSVGTQNKDLESLRMQILDLAKRKGLDVKSLEKLQSDKLIPEEKISLANIPNWESLVKRANTEIEGDVILEDLLTKDEFNFCIEEIERINTEFANKTKLSGVDLSFLLIATALQSVRWLLIQHLSGGLGEKIEPGSRLLHNDKAIKDEVNRSNSSFKNMFSEHGHRESRRNYKSWENIIFNSVPYDTSINSSTFGENLEGRYHRYKTLGHDPVLGWIFGTANIITDTVTLSNFNSYRIKRSPGPRFDEQTNLFQIFYEVYDSTKEDWLRLPAGIFAQFVHLKSDAFTKLGLPVPILESFSENLAGKLYRSQYDSLCLMKDLNIVGNQAMFSIIINMVIGLVHGLFYNPEKDGQREFYEVRTRKILSISNALASSGNVLYALLSKDLKKLDIGGMLVTLSRLYTDARFITKIKRDFINGELDKVLEEEIRQIDDYFQ